MKKLMLVVAVLALILAIPATASAHKLGKGFAVKQARAVAQDYAFAHYWYTPDDVVSSPVGWAQRRFCTRFSPHKVVCAVAWIYEEDVSSSAFVNCTARAQSKLKRRSNVVVTALLESTLDCVEEQPLAAAMRQRVP